MFLNPGEFPFTAVLESKWRDIRREFTRLTPERLTPWPETNLYNQGWEVFGLWAMGQKLEGNCRLCPVTAAAVESVPRLTTAGFSLLAPGGRIQPHVGYTNSVLRCHLGVIVPHGCAIQVGDERREWNEGKCLLFDDTILHSAWNESNESRIILLIDFIRDGRQFDMTISDEFAQLLHEINMRDSSK